MTDPKETTMDNQTAAENFMRVLSEGRMIRGRYNGIASDGRELACAYAAAVSGARDTFNCPAAVMPQWVADLTPWLNDAGTKGSYYPYMLRYGTVMARWQVLSPEDWNDISRRFRAQCCIAALASAKLVIPPDAGYWSAVVRASEAISTCLLAGKEPTADMIRSTWAAWAAARAERAARAAEWVLARAERAARAAERAAETAARAAETAARAAETAAWTAETAARMARTAADILINHFLTFVEQAVERNEPKERFNGLSKREYKALAKQSSGERFE